MTEKGKPHHNTIGSPYYRTEVGAHENSVSPYDTFDMGGNVWEWNEALIGSNRGIRGGSYVSYDIGLRSSSRSSIDPDDEYYGVGFRVASVPEPATLSLLGLGSLALIRRKRRTHNIKKVFFIVAGLLLALSGAANAEIIYSGANQNVTYSQYSYNPDPISIAAK